MYLKFISLIIVSFTFIIVSCIRTVDISGVYKGEIILEEDEIDKVEIILNQIGKNISGSLTFEGIETSHIKSGIIEGNSVTFIVTNKWMDENFMERVMELKFEGNIKRGKLEGNLELIIRGYRIIGDVWDLSTIPFSETATGTLAALRQ